MTNYYKKDELNSKHLVAFHQKPEDKHLKYYVFEQKEWVNCTPCDNLPYGIINYKLSNESKSSKNYIGALPNSYRLAEDNFPSDEEMENERKWREELNAGDELEYFHEDKWNVAKIHGIKADIIPRVFRLVHQGVSGSMIPGNKMYGYIIIS